MSIKAYKRVMVKRHDHTLTYTVLAMENDPDNQIRIELHSRVKQKNRPKKENTFHMDQFGSMDTALKWLERKVREKTRENYHILVEKCFSRDEAKRLDEQAGHTFHPDTPMEDIEVEYTYVTEGEETVYVPSSLTAEEAILEIRDQWVYVCGPFNIAKLKNFLSYYVEGSKFSQKGKMACTACRGMAIDKFFCMKCKRGTKKTRTHACGNAVVKNWCRDCGEPTTLAPRWDGRISLLDGRGNKFPIGLLDMSVKFLMKSGHSVRVLDTRVKPDPNEDRPIMVHKLSIDDRPYQVKAVEKMLEKEQGLLYLATNAGKTVIAAAFMNKLDRPTVFICRGIELVVQQRARLEQMLGEKVGMIGSDLKKKKVFDPRKYTVASVDTLARGLKDKNKKIQTFLNSVDCIIVDEAHHAASDSWYKTIMACPAYWRFGLSGTALDRGDNKNIKNIACLGDVIVKLKNQYLIDNNLSLKPYISMIEFPKDCFHLPPNTKNDWQNTLKYGIIYCDVRNAAIAAKAQQYHAQGKATIIMVNEERHGSELMKYIPESIQHKFIHSKSPDREQAALDFKEGRLPILISTPLFDEGIDIQGIDAIILASGGKSVIKLLQRLGRGMRVGKGTAGTDNPLLYVTDFIDRHHPILARHAIERLKTYKNEDCFALVREIFET